MGHRGHSSNFNDLSIRVNLLVTSAFHLAANTRLFLAGPEAPVPEAGWAALPPFPAAISAFPALPP